MCYKMFNLICVVFLLQCFEIELCNSLLEIAVVLVDWTFFHNRRKEGVDAMEKRLISFQLLLDTCKWFPYIDLILYCAFNYGLSFGLFSVLILTFKLFISFSSFEFWKLRNIFIDLKSHRDIDGTVTCMWHGKK